ncbi:lasso peptide biosynthesis B2 protein [Novosphingobium cyanobacteriorum]|uniref:Lasso peptide biosynthesis B2 protein n=1 Tax=Novosphingobium cyanobacteriorum TaxID=3024215 RepID=A0ABT6CID4_9SPHN|nr:lasso peptide biosynthesis B2 protein [Novosphingobium cyanobacteriorum]MDF8333685.1 lasso peptide biosynthesis B2 protein [Novosphingobium cyanobacteriorum]
MVLDLTQDRYSLFEGHAARTLIALRDGRPVEPCDPIIRTLARKGLVSFDSPMPGPWLDMDDLTEAQESALEGPDTSTVLDPGQAAAAIACVKARIDLRRRDLRGLLETFPTNLRGRPLAQLIDLARRFDRGRRLAPVKPRCLPDTFAFVRCARRRGHAVVMVFGVKLYPFEAHCWAQAGSLVLTDPLDRVRRFKPILAL